MRGPKITPPPPPPDGFDPDDRSWHGYKRGWRSEAIWVDLRPVRARAEAIGRERFRKAKKAMAAGGQTHNGLTPQEIAQMIGACGEIGFAMLVGGRLMGKGKKGDVLCRSGDIYEVKTCFKHWPYDRFNPSANANLQYFPQAPLVLVAAEGYPQCLDRVCVVGWLPREDAYDAREKVMGANGQFWSFRWKEGLWHSVYEIMNDELADPALAIGMPGRRHVGDTGLPMYIEHYISGRSGAATTGPVAPRIPEVAGSARTGAPNLGKGGAPILRPKELN